MDKKPFWWPERADEKWAQSIREEYEETATWDDERIREEYNHDNEWVTTWDHIGDAYRDYAPLAESYLEVVSAVKIAISAIEDAISPNVGLDEPTGKAVIKSLMDSLPEEK